jgi:hypothetical protein
MSVVGSHITVSVLVPVGSTVITMPLDEAAANEVGAGVIFADDPVSELVGRVPLSEMVGAEIPSPLVIVAVPAAELAVVEPTVPLKVVVGTLPSVVV